MINDTDPLITIIALQFRLEINETVSRDLFFFSLQGPELWSARLSTSGNTAYCILHASEYQYLSPETQLAPFPNMVQCKSLFF